MQKSYVQIDPKDNIIVAITDLEKGTVITIADQEVTLIEHIKQKHKFALFNFNLGDDIFMYGVLIGKAMTKIAAGDAITIENVKHASAEFSDTKVAFNWQAPDVSKFENRTFNGYHREDGKVGTANYWLVIPLTFCENRNLDVIEAALSEKLGYQTTKDFAARKFEEFHCHIPLIFMSILARRKHLRTTTEYPR